MDAMLLAVSADQTGLRNNGLLEKKNYMPPQPLTAQIANCAPVPFSLSAPSRRLVRSQNLVIHGDAQAPPSLEGVRLRGGAHSSNAACDYATPLRPSCTHAGCLALGYCLLASCWCYFVQV